jgi:predicted transposase YdaD
LIELDPHGWLDWLGLPADGPIESIETDLGTVLAEVDKLLLIDGPEPWIAHIEVQSNRDPGLPSRLLQYNALVHHRRNQIRVETTVVLLRPEADGAELSGRYDPYEGRSTRKLTFDYQVIRLWERPADELLSGGIGVSPLAPLASVDQAELSHLMGQISQRFTRETNDSIASELRNVLMLLLNLRYDEQEVEAMIQDLAELRDTPVYRAIERMGRAEERLSQTRRILLDLGTDKFGAPDENTAVALAGVEDVAALERLLHRLLTVNTWQELLTPES